MKTPVLLSICSGLMSAFAQNTSQFDPSNYASDDVITRDVAVVGGGATGTYGAINLKLLGKSVVLVEKEAMLGGHTNTYTDPTTGVSVDYGTQAFWNSTSSTTLSFLCGPPIMECETELLLLGRDSRALHS